jgi:hypothetical protein
MSRAHASAAPHGETNSLSTWLAALRTVHVVWLVTVRIERKPAAS